MLFAYLWNKFVQPEQEKSRGFAYKFIKTIGMVIFCLVEMVALLYVLYFISTAIAWIFYSFSHTTGGSFGMIAKFLGYFLPFVR